MTTKPVAFTPELLADLRVPADPQISPDGCWIAVTVTTNSRAGDHKRSAIWLAVADSSEPARQLTSGLAEDSHPRWSPDGSTLAFLSDRAKPGVKQVQVLSLDGGEARSVTEAAGGVADFAWLPGAVERLVYLPVDARDPAEEERRTKEKDDAKVFGEFWPRARLAALDVAAGANRAIDVGERHVAELAPAPDGRRVALILWPTPEFDWWAAGGELAVVDLESCVLTVVAGPGAEVGSVVWSRDGATLYFVGPGGETAVSSSQLWEVTVAGGAVPTLLTPDVPYCVEEIVRPVEWDDLLLLSATGVGTTILRYDVGARRLETMLEYPHEALGLSASANGAVISVVADTPTRPLEVHAARLGEGATLNRVSELQADLDRLDLGPQEVLRWERAGFALDGILIWPPGKSRADGPLPTLVSIHGGPYGRWPHGFQGGRFGRWLAQHGYLVFMPNPRGGAGHGQAFAESVLCTVGNDDYLDIMAGVDTLVDQGLADPDRLGCGGWSQGGFMTAWIVGHTTRFRAAVMGAGVSDWGMMIATSDIPSYETLMGGGNPYESSGPHTFDAQSPISYLHNVTTPVLIVHGEQDERVPVSQGAFFHRGLRRYGVETELVVYPREPHGIQERQHQIDLARRIADWYLRWIPVE